MYFTDLELLAYPIVREENFTAIQYFSMHRKVII